MSAISAREHNQQAPTLMMRFGSDMRLEQGRSGEKVEVGEVVRG